MIADIALLRYRPQVQRLPMVVQTSATGAEFDVSVINRHLRDLRVIVNHAIAAPTVLARAGTVAIAEVGAHVV